LRQDHLRSLNTNGDEMSTVSLLDDKDLTPAAAAVFADIRATRQTDFVNNFWRALAHDPDLLARTWQSAKQVMAPGSLDAKGMSEAEYMELVGVIGMAAQTNRLALALQVPVDDVFKTPPLGTSAAQS
jgi:alkylhydroperoxidase family enzyme